MGSCCKGVCWSAPCQPVLCAGGYHERKNPLACQGKIFCICFVDTSSATEKSYSKGDIFSFTPARVPKDKIDRKPLSIYRKNINKSKGKKKKNNQTRPQKEIRPADIAIIPSASPFSGERESTPGPISYRNLVVHVQNLYQLTRFGSFSHKVQWVAGAHGEVTNLIFH